jgi:hypothetical protein
MELQVVSYITLAPLDFCKAEIVQWGSWLVQAISRVTSSIPVAVRRETAIMEQARATFLTTYLSWVRPSLLALLVGVLTTVFTLIGAASNAVPVILKTLNLPACFASNVYGGTQTDFKKEGEIWREYAPEAVAYRYEFKEVRRTRDEIILRNLTPREPPADSATLVVHLPICDGTAWLTEGLPEHSTNLEQVWRK